MCGRYCDDYSRKSAFNAGKILSLHLETCVPNDVLILQLTALYDDLLPLFIVGKQALVLLFQIGTV